jgi:hypothetical protein
MFSQPVGEIKFPQSYKAASALLWHKTKVNYKGSKQKYTSPYCSSNPVAF